jgi:hypothetical protein
MKAQVTGLLSLGCLAALSLSVEPTGSVAGEKIDPGKEKATPLPLPDSASKEHGRVDRYGDPLRCDYGTLLSMLWPSPRTTSWSLLLTRTVFASGTSAQEPT